MSNDVLLVPVNVEQPNVEAQSDIVVYVPQAHKNKAGIVKEGEGINIENGVVSLDRQTVEDMIDANKWVSYGFQQNLTEDEKGMARHNIGAGDNDFTGSYYDVTQKPHLSTDNSISLPIGDEEINNTVQLHKISKTGSFNDLNDVPHETLDFAESERQKSKNLFNVNNGVLPGGLNNGSVANTDMLYFSISNGVLSLTVAASWRGIHSDYFPLKENTIYTFAKQSGDSAYCIIEMYDASKTYLGNVDVQFNDILTFTTVSGTAYARISFSNTAVGTVEISEIYLAEESSFSGYTKYGGAICHKGDAEIQFAETEKEKSKNLLPVMSTAEVITIGENGLITFNGNVGAWRYDIFIGEVYLKKGKTYTLSIHNYSGSGKQLLLFRAKKVSDGTEIREYLYTYETEGRVTPTEDVILISGGFYFANEMTVNFSCFVQIEEGDVVTDYQPYNGAIVHEKDIADLKKYPIQAMLRLSADQLNIDDYSNTIINFDRLNDINNSSGLISLNNGILSFDNKVKKVCIKGCVTFGNTGHAVAINTYVNEVETYGNLSAKGVDENTQICNLELPLIDVSNGEQISLRIFSTTTCDVTYFYTKILVEMYL